MSSIYFNVMVGNERKYTVEIRCVAENTTPPVWGYEITGSHRVPAYRSTLTCPPCDELELVTAVLADWRLANYRESAEKTSYKTT